MMKSNKYFILLLVAALLSACKPEIDSFEPSAGNADFSTYVALGNSLTSGYKDGDLFKSGQEVSYPNIIAQQLKLVGGGEFKQPLMYDELGFGNRLVLRLREVKDCSGQAVPGAAPSLGPVPLRLLDPAIPDPRNFTNSAELAGSNNLGVPGAKSFHLLAPGYGGLNPYFGRFANNPQTSSILMDAMAKNPTFFSLWIGNNDVLTYALAGGEADSVTSVPYFTMAYGAILTSLHSIGAKGVVATVPDITNIPYFTTVPFNALVLTDPQQVAGLNQAYSALNITFALGQNGFIIQDANVPGGMRQIKSTELILLSIPQDSLKCAGWGSLKPIPMQYVLDEEEILNIKTATEGYNAAILSFSNDFDLAFVDVNALFAQARSGMIFDGVKFNTSYITGGLISIDGIHLTARGNALMANKFIEAINLKYQANIPLVDITEYDGITFP